MKLVPLSEIADEYLFWPGATFRRAGVGMNGVPPERDFYDYMLVSLAFDNEPMVVVNVTIGNMKAGHTICSVDRASINGNCVDAQTIRQAIGDDKIHYIEQYP
ncbi:hypothetical protein [Hymenobacter rigui]|uniref:Uncharacterized protein n=1 Tax=Hymenobacter rigui TaxID=334424 RepID=A0A3R9P4G6_9BACT|nr:hypothetical protein [Hymenobacter rigui]RSK48527.1 hypothetical protein EI291_12485 [Hymenobacter rigui]